MVNRQKDLLNMKPLVAKMAEDYENGEAINLQFAYAERIRLLCYILQLELLHDKLPSRQQEVKKIILEEFRTDHGDPLAAAFTKQIKDHSKDGLPTVSNLVASFAHAKKAAQFEILVPNDSMWNFVWGQSLSFIKLAFIGNVSIKYISSTKSEELSQLIKLDHAEELLVNGQLQEALDLLDDINKRNPKVKSVLQKWIANAQDRIMQEQILDVLKTHSNTIANQGFNLLKKQKGLIDI